MKKKLFSVLLCAALIGTMVIGCGGNGGDAETDDAGTSTEADSGDDGGDAAPAGDLNIEIVSKGFQHQYWQAVLKGAFQRLCKSTIALTWFLVTASQMRSISSLVVARGFSISKCFLCSAKVTAISA